MARCDQFVACLDEAAVEDRGFGRERLLHVADFDQPFRHLVIGRVRHVAVEAEQLQLGDEIVIGQCGNPCGSCLACLTRMSTACCLLAGL